MARSKSPIQIQGRVHNLLFRLIDGQQYVQMAPNNDGQHKKRKKDPERYLRYLRNAAEFAGASKIACDIYRHIRTNKNDPTSGLLRPYAHNRMIARLKEAGDFHKKDGIQGRHYAQAYSLFDVQKALKGLDLSHDAAPTSHVRMVPIGPQHNPDAIRVLGLEHAADAIGANGNASLEFRFRISQAQVDEIVLDQHGEWILAKKPEDITQQNSIDPSRSYPSGWIPTEIIPAEGFLLALPRQEDGAKYITAIHVEWREHKTVGRRILYHRKKAIVQIAAVHGPAEDFIQPENPFLEGKPRYNPKQDAPQA